MAIKFKKNYPKPELLLHPQIPKPLHSVNPRLIMGQEWWDIERQKAYESTMFHCKACGVHSLKAIIHQWLEAHETYEIDFSKGLAKFIEVVPLCHACHKYIHRGGYKQQVEDGIVPVKEYHQVMEHGMALLAKHKLMGHRPPPIGTIPAWGSWRLEFNGKLYKPRFLDLGAHDKYYSTPGTLPPIEYETIPSK